MNEFDRAFTIVVGVEGGYNNDVRDPGGETKYGISKRSYPHLDIKNLTLDQAKRIYESDYWWKSGANALPWPWSLVVFDMAVNSGIRPAVQCLQRSLKLAQDGLIGPITEGMVKRATQDDLAGFLAERALFYMNLGTFHHFGKGWLKRLFHLAFEA